MAERRMISKTLLEDDIFRKLSLGSRHLYSVLCVYCDDRGYIRKTETALEIAGVTKKQLNMLIQRGYVMDRGNGLYLIKHWLWTNRLQPSRIKETLFIDDYETIFITKTNEYSAEPVVGSRTTEIEILKVAQAEAEKHAKEEAKRIKQKSSKIENHNVIAIDNEQSLESNNHVEETCELSEDFSQLEFDDLDKSSSEFTNSCVSLLSKSKYLSDEDHCQRYKYNDAIDELSKNFTRKNVSISLQYFIRGACDKKFDSLTKTHLYTGIKKNLNIDDKFSYFKSSLTSNCNKYSSI